MSVRTTREIKIEIAGTQDLKASDLAIIKFLCRHTGDCGGIVDPKTGCSIPLSLITQPRTKHADRNVLWDSLDRLMSAKANVVQSCQLTLQVLADKLINPKAN